MHKNSVTNRIIPGPCAWAGIGSLVLVMTIAACSASPSPAAPPVSTAPPTTPAPTLTATATPVPVPTLPPLQPLATITPQPDGTPTPFPDAVEIADAVMGLKGSEHWVAHRVEGSFTGPETEESMAIVGNIGDQDEVRWVIVGEAEAGRELRGTSDLLGSGFDAPPPNYFPPQPIDFDGDGQQEALVNYFRMQGGWLTSSDTIYRWDGHTLASIWNAVTVVDNTLANPEDVPQPYKENYQAEWEWVDVDGDGTDEILLREHGIFHPIDETRWAEDDLTPLGEEVWELTFRWDGEALHPYALNGPGGTLAYVFEGRLWLWRDRVAQPLGVTHVEALAWSPDGRRLAWYAQPLPADISPEANLGIYDVATGGKQEFSLDVAPVDLRWVSDGRLAYHLPESPPVLLDTETGQQEPLPIPSLGTWAPDGERIAYPHDGNLSVYDRRAGQLRALVVAPEGMGQAIPRARAAKWSPRGDYIACALETEDFVYVGLASPDAPEPVNTYDLTLAFAGREVPSVQFAWSPDGSHLAALTNDPGVKQQPGTLYVAEVPPDGDEPVGRLAWQETLSLEAVAPIARLAWSPGGEQVAVGAGNEVWQVTTAGEATLRHRFSAPETEWMALEWAPDGSGLLVELASAGVGYRDHLFWLPTTGGDPVPLVAGQLGAAQWAPVQ